MATYRVRPGEVLAHGGRILDAGAVVTLERRIADDPAVRGALEEVDDKGQPIPSAPPDALAAYRTHERVGVLRDRLAEAQASVTDLQTQLAAEEQRLVDEVKTITAVPKGGKPKSDPVPVSAPASVKEQ